MHPRDDLLFQAADALHEKFVEIGRGDRQELEPLEQRISFVFRFVQNPPIEREPRELAIEVQVGRDEVLVDVEARRLLDRQGGSIANRSDGRSNRQRRSILRRRRVRDRRRNSYPVIVRLIRHLLVHFHPAPHLILPSAF